MNEIFTVPTICENMSFPQKKHFSHWDRRFTVPGFAKVHLQHHENEAAQGDEVMSGRSHHVMLLKAIPYFDVYTKSIIIICRLLYNIVLNHYYIPNCILPSWNWIDPAYIVQISEEKTVKVKKKSRLFSLIFVQRQPSSCNSFKVEWHEIQKHLSKHDALHKHTSIIQHTTTTTSPAWSIWPGPKSKAASLGRRFNLVNISVALDPQENITIALEESDIWLPDGGGWLFGNVGSFQG